MSALASPSDAAASGSTPPLHITVLLDVISPYSFAAFESLRRYTAPGGPWHGQVAVSLRPVLLGGVMAGSGNEPPAMLPARGVGMSRDLKRLGLVLGEKLGTPAAFPVSTLTAQRVWVALCLRDSDSDDNDGQKKETEDDATQTQTQTQFASCAPDSVGARFAAACWRGYWGGEVLLNDPEVLAALLCRPDVGAAPDKAAAEALIARAGSDAAVKAALKAATDDAVERGVYGAPTWFVQGKPLPGSLGAQEGPRGGQDPGALRRDGPDAPAFYFGSDRLEQFAAIYGLPWHGLGCRTAPPTAGAAAAAAAPAAKL